MIVIKCTLLWLFFSRLFFENFFMAQILSCEIKSNVTVTELPSPFNRKIPIMYFTFGPFTLNQSIYERLQSIFILLWNGIFLVVRKKKCLKSNTHKKRIHWSWKRIFFFYLRPKELKKYFWRKSALSYADGREFAHFFWTHKAFAFFVCSLNSTPFMYTETRSNSNADKNLLQIKIINEIMFSPTFLCLWFVCIECARVSAF